MPRNSLDELLELQLDVLGQHYEIPDKPAILHFLRSHRDVFYILRAAYWPLFSAFKEECTRVRLAKDEDQIRVTAILPCWHPGTRPEYLPDPATAMLAFEQSWWFDKQPNPGGSFVVLDWASLEEWLF